MPNLYNGLPSKTPVATESQSGLMSFKDKKTLNRLVVQVAEMLKSIGNISTDKLARANANIKNNDNICGMASLNGDTVTVNITMTVDNKDLFILPEEFRPRTSLMYLIPIVKAGKVTTGQLHIFADGTVSCTCSSYKDIIINTSVSFVK